METQPLNHTHGAGRRTRRFDPTLPPLVFLDFDGVLHPNQATPEQRFEHVGVLMDILDKHPEAELVVSSSWRHHFSWDVLRVEIPHRLAARLTKATGAAMPGKFQRHAEVSHLVQCLEADGQGARPWCALDDCAWEFPPDCEELIACDGARGIQERELHQLQGWLSQLDSCRKAWQMEAAPIASDILGRAFEILDAAYVPNVALLQRRFRLGLADALHLLRAYLHDTPSDIEASGHAAAKG